jgi:1-aminocyclopropane-1-carboxylate deaminase/D-cysteine desulfhydrase-like pyridoxal-dependent ACC family enzyme
VFVFPVLKGFQSIAEMKQISESADCLTEWENHQHKVQVFDNFYFGGYAKSTPELLSFISDFEQKTGIPLDPTYTGKALFGLIKTIEDRKLMNKRILFIHTGGVHKLLK